MKVFLKTGFVLTTTLILSCNTQTNNESRKKLSDSSIGSSNKHSEDYSKEENKPKTTSSESITSLYFTDISLSIHSFISEESEIDFSQVQENTLYIYLGYDSDPIENQIVSITKNSLNNLKIEQRIQTSIGVYMKDGEAGSCSLEDWKNDYSKWRSLKLNSLNQFTYSAYSDKEEQFFNIPLEEVKNELIKRCGTNTLGELKSVHEMPCEIFVSRLDLRITGKRIDTGKLVVLNLHFIPPTGC
ncbi:hypothetical protein [Fluviicola taffensis]|uniref:Lipoprotein n=1 Tax=Fluviicola taffensis (strain DSM 16823 / NCIMB 13979 / RW262) TaxID=755732 RepID=F2IA27_FLUTR|nr:hypothetical protein [Fluviicola taffensis]AEA45204.1 hypothetical protein Fluta_3231 [Fluviicola taffensis DSM 16823]